ncbi:MAG: YihY/virulence factor BrkB family protein [Deltaproteobacteria bacterium]|nr:YihY/virulence factor BrkB family protein [Deltaproteobacteria bacterium]
MIFLKSLLLKTYRIIYATALTFDKHSSFSRASSISFYAFFSVIPLLLIVTAAWGFILGTDAELLAKVLDVVRVGFPYISEGIVEDLTSLLQKKSTIGWVGSGLLLVSSLLVIHALEGALYPIFRASAPRGFFLRRLVTVAVLMVVILLIIISLMLSLLLSFAKGGELIFLGIDMSPYLLSLLGLKSFLPTLLTITATTFVYKLVGGSAVNTRATFYGAVVFTVLWQLAGTVFSFYVSHLAFYNKFYGSLGALMVFLLWIYYSSSIFLLGASFAEAHSEDEGFW